MSNEMHPGMLKFLRATLGASVPGAAEKELIRATYDMGFEDGARAPLAVLHELVRFHATEIENLQHSPIFDDKPKRRARLIASERAFEHRLRFICKFHGVRFPHLSLEEITDIRVRSAAQRRAYEDTPLSTPPTQRKDDT